MKMGYFYNSRGAAMASKQFGFKQQQCSVFGLVFSWIVYVAGLIFFRIEGHWVGGLLWLVVVPIVRLALFRYFPNISHFLGYGRVDDNFLPT